MSHLTAVFRLRANPHDAARLRTALRRWHHSFALALAQARARQRDLLRCLVVWTSKDGARTKLVVDGKAGLLLASTRAGTGL